MCGITAILKSLKIQDKSIRSYILDSLKILQNRGYDSAGILLGGKRALTRMQKVASTRKSSAIDILNNYEYNFEQNFEQNSNEFSVGIGHTRWATHGSKTDINAHPHLDTVFEKIFVVHNGIIENYREIYNYLSHAGVHFKSETDTEVVSNLLGTLWQQEIQQNPNSKDFLNILYKATELLRGTWAFVIYHTDFPECIFASRNGSPLLLGYNRDSSQVSQSRSDTSISVSVLFIQS